MQSRPPVLSSAQPALPPLSLLAWLHRTPRRLHLPSLPPWLRLPYPALGRASPSALVPACIASVWEERSLPVAPIRSAGAWAHSTPDFRARALLTSTLLTEENLPAARYSPAKTPGAHLSTAGCHHRTRRPSTRTSRRYCNTSGVTISYLLTPGSGLSSLAPRPTTRGRTSPSAPETSAWTSGPGALSSLS